MEDRPVILSIAGYDPSSGAGVTADVKTAAALGCYAVTCISALTIQTTQGVFRMQPMVAEVVRETLFRLAEDVKIAAVRIGMLGSGVVAGVVADFLRQATQRNVVLDPVLQSSSGTALIDADGIGLIRSELLPVCDVVTPNVPEAVELAEMGGGTVRDFDSWESTLPLLRGLAAKLHDMGCRAVVVTGGHLQQANDYLSVRDSGGTRERVFAGSRLDSRSTHGTGCAFATAVACELANGHSLSEAVQHAKEYVRRAIAAAYPVGKGAGAMNHLFQLEPEK